MSCPSSVLSVFCTLVNGYMPLTSTRREWLLKGVRLTWISCSLTCSTKQLAWLWGAEESLAIRKTVPPKHWRNKNKNTRISREAVGSVKEGETAAKPCFNSEQLREILSAYYFMFKCCSRCPLFFVYSTLGRLIYYSRSCSIDLLIREDGFCWYSFRMDANKSEVNNNEKREQNRGQWGYAWSWSNTLLAMKMRTAAKNPILTTIMLCRWSLFVKCTWPQDSSLQFSSNNGPT